MKITIEHLKHLLDELGIKYRSNDSENIIFIFVNEDSNTSYRFTYTIPGDNEKVSAQCSLCNTSVKKKDINKAIRFCNTWSTNHFLPHPFVDDESQLIVCEWYWDTMIDYPKDFIKDVIFNAFISTSMKCLDLAIKEGILPIPPPQDKKKKKRASSKKDRPLLDIVSIQQLKAVPSKNTDS